MVSDDPVIQVEHLGKQYRIGLAETRPANLRDALVRTVRAPFNYLRSRLRPVSEAEILWALRDISFTVQRGEILGVIGRNGAGKSTLLKILSRITDPTEGSAVIRGRVNSLLEVGTGFHPELTGRENIYMNAAMHGMKRVVIDRSLGRIIEFSGIERFIDTPVKRYSSGMYTRLAFAVAAHLDPDILIVDEVLAVGDAAFQERCIEKMGSVASEGRTVLFVSHNMQAIASLCSRCLLLEDGRVRISDTPRRVIEAYLESRVVPVAEQEWPPEQAPGGDTAAIHALRVLTAEGKPSYDQDMGGAIDLEMEFWIRKPAIQANVSFHVYNEQNICLFAVANHHDPEWGSRVFNPGLYRCRCRIPADLLNEGRHHIWAFVVRDKMQILAQAQEAVAFQVNDYGTSRGGYVGPWAGVVRPLLSWGMERVGEST